MAPKPGKEDVVATLTAKLFASMLDEIVMDATLEAYHNEAKSLAICELCGTKCNSVHPPSPSSSSLPSSQPTQRSTAETPHPAEGAVTQPNGSSVNGTSTPTTVKADGTVILECVNCSRPIASNRYAPHLSSCMGLASSRRGPARNTSKPKTPSQTGRSVSPESDFEPNSDDNLALSLKSKTKLSKSKRTDEAEFNLKRKRPMSPQSSPNKKQKKLTGSPVSRVKSRTDATGPMPHGAVISSTGSQSKIPSKLRESSFLERSATPPSRSSSLGIPAPTTPASSLSGNSPALKARIPPSQVVKGKGPPPKRPSPARPSSLPVHYRQDDPGEETGSSTDSDSS